MEAEKDALEPGVILLQIDGLAYAQLQQALADGRMPFLRRLIKSLLQKS